MLGGADPLSVSGRSTRSTKVARIALDVIQRLICRKHSAAMVKTKRSVLVQVEVMNATDERNTSFAIDIYKQEEDGRRKLASE